MDPEETEDLYNNDLYWDYNNDRYGEASGPTYSAIDDALAGIPLIGDLTGSNYRRAAAERALAERRRGAALADLAGTMPSEDDLSVLYESDQYVGDRTAEGARARENWMDWSEGGLTDADRSMMNEASRRASVAARGDREASLSALEARGMGGSGAALASALSSGEGAADRASMMNTAALAEAQQRQVGATDSLADWAEGETGYRRGMEGRRTDALNRTRESRAAANQGAYENRERHTSLALGMNPAGGDPEEEQDESDEAAGNFFTSLLS